MNLGIIALGSTLSCCLQLANGNSPQTADAQPTYRIYSGATLVTSGTLSASVVDSQTGWHSISQAITTSGNFSAGIYTIRVSYAVSSVAKVQEFSFQVA